MAEMFASVTMTWEMPDGRQVVTRKRRIASRGEPFTFDEQQAKVHLVAHELFIDAMVTVGAPVV